MAYEYEEFIDAMRFGLTMSDRDSTDDIWKMVDEVVNKAKAFDTFLKYKEHVEKYNNSDCHELERVFEFVMKEYEEDG